MTDKQKAKEVIDLLPESADLNQILHAIYVHLKFKRGEQEITDGRGISHEDAKERLKKWQK